MMKNIADKNTGRIAFVFIIAEIIAVVLPVIILGKYFEFPDILREPAHKGMLLFKENQSIIVPSYYLFMFSGLLYIPLSAFLLRAFESSKNTLLSQIFMTLGICTAIFQSIGFSRWIFVIPFLVEQYFKEESNRAMIELIYESLNRYVGMTIGEHLGFIAMGFWTLALANLQPYQSWIRISGWMIGLLLLLSTLEHFGGNYAPYFGFLNFLANTLWSFWLLALGIMILRNQ